MKIFLNTVFTVFLSVICNITIAYEIRKPSFVDTANVGDLDDAGDTIMLWIAGIFGIMVVVACSYVGFLFVQGKSEEAIERTKQIVFGLVAFAVLGGVALKVGSSF